MLISNLSKLAVATVALATVTCAHMNKPLSGDHGFLRNQEGRIRLWKKDQIPLTVFHNGGKYIKKECNWVNWAAGFTLVHCIETNLVEGLATAIKNTDNAGYRIADIVIMVEEDVGPREEAGYAGFAGIYSDNFGNILFAEIHIVNREYYVAAHEIFHALGLAHDDRKESIMNPYVKEPMEFPRLSEYDAWLLKKAYK